MTHIPSQKDLISFIKLSSDNRTTYHILNWLNENPDNKIRYQKLIASVINKTY